MIQQDIDVVIVGAGISGIGAAVHLKKSCPDKSVAILEMREALGGTWDLFRYPGIRSDSDMYTLGYAFKPWKDENAIAEGDRILAYLRETVEEYGIADKIRYRRKVERASWSSDAGRWTVTVRNVATGDVETYRCKFLFTCAGYYDYETGHDPSFPGIEGYRGRVVHPQKWTSDIDYAGKKVVIIGSGATAVTLLPSLAKTAAQVTMLQRSPTYVAALPARDAGAHWLREHLPASAAHQAIRWKNILVSSAFYNYCRAFPESARGLLLGGARKALRGKVAVDPHFTPKYDPWDQRVCFAPDGDFFKALREGRAHVVTGSIATFTEKGIRLESGEELEADLVVTATGLKLKLMGGIQLEVDGKAVDVTQCVSYKSALLTDVPNMAVALGYTNASWTLKVELLSRYVCRLLQHMDRTGTDIVVAHRTADVGEERPLLDLASGYVQRAIALLPRQGSRPPFRVYQNYFIDIFLFRFAPVTDEALEFKKATLASTRSPGSKVPIPPAGRLASGM